MSDILISCENVRFSYEKSPTLHNVEVIVHQGDFIGVIGPNGVGKSTLIKVLTGILRPDEGMILLHGTPIERLSKREIARKLAVVSQEEALDFGFTVWEEVMFGRSPHHGGLHFDNYSDRVVVEKALVRTQIDHLASRRLETLSGGERQRVRIARGIAQEPKVIFLDEPTNHLDLYSQLTLMRLLGEVNTQGIAVFLVSHDINFVCQCCRQVYLMHNGTIVSRGLAADVVTSENIALCFGIHAEVLVNPNTGIPRINPVAVMD
ncbi:MAG: iron complex transport system ATP-binding protein [Thermodesulfobacteriota bacterium]|nr:iron complex transport system ATP-binding protein [Thermodesulfobacteriota bacterium]